MDQDRLARLELAAPEQALIRRLSCQRDGCRLDMIEPYRHVGNSAFVQDSPLGVTATKDGNHAEDGVARLEAGRLGAARLHDA